MIETLEQMVRAIENRVLGINLCEVIDINEINENITEVIMSYEIYTTPPTEALNSIMARIPTNNLLIKEKVAHVSGNEYYLYIIGIKCN